MGVVNVDVDLDENQVNQEVDDEEAVVSVADADIRVGVNAENPQKVNEEAVADLENK